MKIKRKVTVRFDQFEPGLGVLTLLKGGEEVISKHVDFTGQRVKQLGETLAWMFKQAYVRRQ